MKTEKKALFSTIFSDFRAGFIASYHESTKKAHESAKNSRQSLIKSLHTGYQSQYQNKLRIYSKQSSSKLLYATAIAVISFLVGLSAGRIFAPVSPTSAASHTVELGETPKVGTITESSETTASGNETVIQDVPKTARSVLAKVTTAELDSVATFSSYGAYHLSGTSTSTNTTASTSTATSTAAATSYALQIPSAGIYANVSQTYVDGNNDIVVPTSGVGVLNTYEGRFFTLFVSHRSSTFKTLSNVRYGDIITYYSTNYRVTSIYQKPISQIDMYELTANSASLKFITCAGANNSERLVVVADPV